MNQVILIGRLTRDVELTNTVSGFSIANFNLAVDKNLSKEKKAEFESQGKATADFIPVKAFGKTAEVASQYLAKGNKVAIRGSLDVNRYTDSEGANRTFTSVLVEKLEFLESASNSQGGQGAFSRQHSGHEDTIEEMYRDFNAHSDFPF